MRMIYASYIRFPTEKAHGIHVAKTCEAFAEKGLDVELIVPKSRVPQVVDPVAFYGLRKGFRVTMLSSPSLFPATFIGYSVSSFLFGISLFFYLRRKKNEYDFLYSMELEPLGNIFLPFTKPPYFLEIHGPRKRISHYPLVFSKIAGIVVLNATIKNALVSVFPKLSGKIIVRPSAMELPKEEILKNTAREKLGIQQNEKAAVYTGSFLYWKGVDTILAAAALVPDISFYLVGGAKEELKEFEIPVNVRIIGKRPHSEMHYWQGSADALLASGTARDEKSYLYTSPMKLVEYMASRRPIIAARTPAIEFAAHDREVLFYEPDNASSLAEKIRYVFASPSEGREYAERAYERAKEYSWDTRTKKILQFVRSRL